MQSEKVKEHVAEVLAMSGSKQRYFGTIVEVDGTTSIVESGERRFLAWSRPDLKTGTEVTFRMDSQRAADVMVAPTPAPPAVKQAESQTETVTPLVPITQPTTAIAHAFNRIFKN